MRIDFVSPPFAGHLNPLVVLARAARLQGFRCRFITGAEKSPVLAAYGFEVQSITENRLESIANTPEPVGSNPMRMVRQLRRTFSLLPGVYTELLARWRGDPPDLVVADSVAPVAGAACEQLAVPWITTIATPFVIEQKTGTPPYCGGWKPGNPLRDAAGRTATRLFKRAMGAMFSRQLKSIGIGRLHREDSTEAIYSARAILGFGISGLEFPRDWPPAFRMIGPVVEAPEHIPPIVYSLPRPRILVSLGTHLPWAKKGLRQQVEQLAAQWPGVSFVVSRGEPRNADQAAQVISPRIVEHAFVPYARDLPQFDAVIHHGGAGITYSAILAGLPSAVVPHDYDQFDYAARIEHYGAGLRARTIDDIPVGRLLNSEQWSGIGALQREAVSYRPAESFLQVVQSIVNNR